MPKQPELPETPDTPEDEKTRVLGDYAYSLEFPELLRGATKIRKDSMEYDDNPYLQEHCALLATWYERMYAQWEEIRKLPVIAHG